MKTDAGAGEGRATYPPSFFVVMVANLLLFLSMHALFPTLPLYIVAIGGSSADNGLAAWVFTLAALLTRPLAGLLADRWGRKPILIAGAVLFGVAPLLYQWAFDMPLLLGVRVVHGVGIALFTTAYQAFIADLLPPGRYGEGLGLANTTSTVAMIVAPLAGEWIVRESGFGTLFSVLGAVGGLGALATLVLPGQEREARDFSGLRQVLREPTVRTGVLGMALLGMPLGAFLTFLPLLAEVRGLGGTGLVYGAYAVVSSLAQPAGGRLADRWGSRRVTLAGLVIAGLGTAGFAGVDARLGLLGFAMLFGAGFGVARAALDAHIQGNIARSLRGGAAAAQYTAFDTVIGFGGLGLGMLAEATNYGVLYAAAGGVTLLGLGIGGWATRARHDQL